MLDLLAVDPNDRAGHGDRSAGVETLTLQAGHLAGTKASVEPEEHDRQVLVAEPLGGRDDGPGLGGSEALDLRLDVLGIAMDPLRLRRAAAETSSLSRAQHRDGPLEVAARRARREVSEPPL